MDWLINLVTNPFLLTGCSAWFVAQVAKTIIHAIINKEMDMNRLFGDGGMPSGHSATVSSLAIITALVYGTASFEFAIAALLAIIVCHDAMGVRYETGKQAVIINDLVESIAILTSKEVPQDKLKEFVGHTPSQVLVGILVGVADAVVMYFVFF